MAETLHGDDNDRILKIGVQAESWTDWELIKDYIIDDLPLTLIESLEEKQKKRLEKQQEKVEESNKSSDAMFRAVRAIEEKKITSEAMNKEMQDMGIGKKLERFYLLKSRHPKKAMKYKQIIEALE